MIRATRSRWKQRREILPFASVDTRNSTQICVSHSTWKLWVSQWYAILNACVSINFAWYLLWCLHSRPEIGLMCVTAILKFCIITAKVKFEVRTIASTFLRSKIYSRKERSRMKKYGQRSSGPLPCFRVIWCFRQNKTVHRNKSPSRFYQQPIFSRQIQRYGRLRHVQIRHREQRSQRQDQSLLHLLEHYARELLHGTFYWCRLVFKRILTW